jgi:hypothetical protein
MVIIGRLVRSDLTPKLRSRDAYFERRLDNMRGIFASRHLPMGQPQLLYEIGNVETHSCSTLPPRRLPSQNSIVAESRRRAISVRFNA